MECPLGIFILRRVPPLSLKSMDATKTWTFGGPYHWESCSFLERALQIFWGDAGDESEVLTQGGVVMRWLTLPEGE